MANKPRDAEHFVPGPHGPALPTRVHPRGLRRPHTREAVLMPEQRLVRVAPRTVLMVVGLLLGIALALWIVWISRRVVAWVLISLFLAMALDPAVQALQRRGLSARLAAAACVYVAVVLAIVLLAALFVPTVVSQLGDLGKAAPGYVQDLTHGRGPLGFLDACARRPRRRAAAACCPARAPRSP
jgi:hypothetical protein